jgi:hypothetical protein
MVNAGTRVLKSATPHRHTLLCAHIPHRCATNTAYAIEETHASPFIATAQDGGCAAIPAFRNASECGESSINPVHKKRFPTMSWRKGGESKAAAHSALTTPSVKS